MSEEEKKRPEEGGDFNVDHVKRDLRGHTVRGGASIMMGRVVRRGVQLLLAGVLARLLSPDDFGIFAMVTAVAGLGPLLVDSGLGIAVVQRKNVSQDQVTNLFWINVASGVVVALAVLAASPLAAWAYGEPAVAGVMALLSLKFVLGGLTGQHAALLRREMRYTVTEAISIGSFVALNVSQIVLAYLGFSYWSLVWGELIGAAVTLTLKWAASGWRPGLPNRRGKIGGMLRYGWNMAAANVLQYFTRKGDAVLVGGFLGKETAGFYSKAYHVMQMPIQETNRPLGGLFVVALARVQDKPEKYRRMFIKAVSVIVSTGLPMVGLACVMAPEIVRVWFGERWMETVPIIQALTLANAVMLTNPVLAWTSTSLGETGKQLRWALIAPPIQVAGYFVGLNWGAVGVAWSFGIVTLALRPFAYMYFFRGTPMRLGDIRRAVWRPVTATTAAALATWGVMWLARGHWPVFAEELALAGLSEVSHGTVWARLLGRLAIGGGVFGVVYGAVFMALPGGAAFVGDLARLVGDLKASRWKRKGRGDEPGDGGDLAVASVE